MASVQDFDELHRLEEFEIGNIYTWFEPMSLSEDEKRKRARAAYEIKMPIALAVAALLREFLSGRKGTGLAASTNRLSAQLVKIMGRVVPINSYLSDIIKDFCNAYMGNTVEMMDTATTTYYMSDSRAERAACNLVNQVFNYAEYLDAIDNGHSHKRWKTMEDERVRPTHNEVHGEIIPIGEYFAVGDSLLLFPGDLSMAPDMNEIINCRCTLEYL